MRSFNTSPSPKKSTPSANQISKISALPHLAFLGYSRLASIVGREVDVFHALENLTRSQSSFTTILHVEVERYSIDPILLLLKLA